MYKTSKKIAEDLAGIVKDIAEMIPVFNKKERAYLRELLEIKLIDLACEITDSSRDEEEIVQAIRDKLEEQ